MFPLHNPRITQIPGWRGTYQLLRGHFQTICADVNVTMKLAFNPLLFNITLFDKYSKIHNNEIPVSLFYRELLSWSIIESQTKPPPPKRHSGVKIYKNNVEVPL